MRGLVTQAGGHNESPGCDLQVTILAGMIDHNLDEAKTTWNCFEKSRASALSMSCFFLQRLSGTIKVGWKNCL